MWTTSFSFQVEPLNAAPYGAVIMLEDTQIFQGQSETGNFIFQISPSAFPDGIVDLVIAVSCLSKSQSLAGQLDAEIIAFTKTFKVLIDNSKPAQVPAPAVAIEDGKLMIRWTAPINQNYTRVAIVRTYTAGSSTQIDTLRPASKSSTAHNDQSYAGGDVSYSIDLQAPQFYRKGASTSFTCVPISLSVDDDRTRVSWTTLLYGNNLSLRYNRVQVLPNTPGGVDINLRFGDPAIVAILELFPKQPERQNPFIYELSMPISRGLPIQSHNSVTYMPSTGVYVLLTPSTTYQLAPGTFQQSATPASGTLMLSQNGSYAYSWNGNFLSNGLGLHRLNSSLSVVESYDLKTMLIGAPGLNNPAMITNDNLLGANFYGSVKQWYILDMSAKTAVWEGNSAFILSPDGSYMLIGETIYTRGSNTWTTSLGELGATYSRYTFRQGPGVNRLYCTAFGGSLTIFDLDGVAVNGILPTVNHILPASDSNGYQYDPYSNKLYRVSGTSLLVYDADTYEEVKVFENINQPQLVTYINGMLFHRNGFLLPPTN